VLQRLIYYISPLTKFGMLVETEKGISGSASEVCSLGGEVEKLASMMYVIGSRLCVSIVNALIVQNCMYVLKTFTQKSFICFTNAERCCIVSVS
jgi:hypothetical protein